MFAGVFGLGDIIVVKNVDKDVYRRVKSVAALKGYTLGRALNEAMRLWLMLNEAPSRGYLEYLVCREKSEKKVLEVQRKYGEKLKGKYVVVCDGEVIGFYDSRDDALSVAGKSSAKECIIAVLGEIAEEKHLALGMGVLE